MKNKINFFIITISLLLNLLLIGYIIFPSFSKVFRTKEKFSDYPLLSPRIFAENQNDILINFLPLRQKLRQMVKDYGDSFAFYFEYLPTGTSIGVNEKAEFNSASLIKVPVVMAYFHREEREGFDLDTINVKIKKNQIDKRFGDLWMKGEGAEISLGEAINLSLIESDNTATRIVADYIPPEDLDAVYEGLDIDFNLEENKILISTKSYASIFKALYFSAVLNKQNSQSILDILSKTKFNDKLPAPLPKNIVVSHKIGVYENDLYQDCGIVYVPKRPYILCMFSQSDENTARERMQKISKTAYDYINQINHTSN